MPNRTVRASVTALTKETQSDPVVEIGAKLAAAREAAERVQEAALKVDKGSLEGSRDCIAFDEDEEALQDYEEALLDLALSLPAKSVASALVQLSVVARHLVRREPSEPDVTDRRIAFGIGSIA